MIYILVFVQKQNLIYGMDGYKHTAGMWSSLIQQLFCSYLKKKKRQGQCYQKKKKKKSKKK